MEIIIYFKDHDWNVIYRYDLFDAGIDYDLIILEKDGEKIYFGWDNWFEGEIACQENRVAEIENQFSIKLTHGEPSSLKPSVIELFYKDDG